MARQEIDLIEVMGVVERRVEKESAREDPVYRAVLAALELRAWINAAKQHLQLIDQSELSGYQVSRLNALASVVLIESAGVTEAVVDAHADYVRAVGSLGWQRTP